MENEEEWKIVKRKYTIKWNSNSKKYKISDWEIVLIIVGILITILYIWYFINNIWESLSHNCETLYDNLVSRNPNITFVENTIKRSNNSTCVAYISILWKINNQNKIDFNLEKWYSINTIWDNNWKDFYWFLVINLDNDSLLTWTLVRLPNKEDINSINSISSVNNMDIASTNAINYFNKL